jgi:hypothetical protein
MRKDSLFLLLRQFLRNAFVLLKTGTGRVLDTCNNVFRPIFQKIKSQ